VSRANSIIRGMGLSVKCKIKLFGYSVLSIPFDLKIKIEKKSKTCIVQKYKTSLDWFDNEGVEVIKGKAILYKKVSTDFLTQEEKPWKTEWKIGTTLIHPAYNPKESECNGGKYHACSRPYFCDEFRNNPGDRYVAIEVTKKYTYVWPNPMYPHKISFKTGRVLYECDRYGKEIKKG
jgi:hypothetical protein